MSRKINRILKLEYLPLWLHAALALVPVVLLFGIPIVPFAIDSKTVPAYWLFAGGFILRFGIGDGVPSDRDKMIGASVLILLAVILLGLLLLNTTLIYRVSTLQSRTWRFKSCALIATVLVFGGTYFSYWLGNNNEKVRDAVQSVDFKRYERISSLPRYGNVDDDLGYAASIGDLSMVQFLIAKGANPNAIVGRGGQTVLSKARARAPYLPGGNADVVNFLGNHGAIE